MQVRKDEKFGYHLVLGVLICSCLSYCITPIGHPGGIMVMAYFAEFSSITMLQYSLVGYTMALILFPLFILTMKYVLKVDATRISSFDPTALKMGMGTMSKAEKISGLIVLAVTLIWLSPDLIKPFSPEIAEAIHGAGIIAPVIIAIGLMCVIRVDDKPLMDFYHALRVGVAWPGCYLIMAAMVLSAAVGNSDIGIVAWVSSILGAQLSSLPPYAFVIVIGLIPEADVFQRQPVRDHRRPNRRHHRLLSGLRDFIASAF